MNVRLRHFARRGIGIATVAVMLAACGSDSDDDSATTDTTTGGGTAVNITASSFTSDFSAMAQLKDLAARGEGMIAVLLPDTTTSARYESFDRPYLTRAFEAAGLSSSDFKIDNAQGSASTMQTQAEAAITQGASVLLVDTCALLSHSIARADELRQPQKLTVALSDELLGQLSPDGKRLYFVSNQNATEIFTQICDDQSRHYCSMKAPTPPGRASARR